MNEHKEHLYVVAIDFDKTIADNTWPELGVPFEGVRQALLELVKNDCYIIIWTCRTTRNEIATWMVENRLPYHAINEQHPHLNKCYGNDTRKIAADIYIDDKNLGGLPSWDVIQQIIIKQLKSITNPILTCTHA